MLVPHEPDADPRIGWVADVCTPLAETAILGTTWSTDRPAREQRGAASVERIHIPDAMGVSARALGLAGAALQRLAAAAERRGRRLPSSVARFAGSWLGYWMVVDALHRRARAETVVPDLIVCHDLLGLIVGVRLKRAWDVPLLYDTHEYWPEADLRHEPWEAAVLTRIERRLIRHADQVVTVSPPLAAHLERLYGIGNVLSVPNAVPADGARAPGEARDGRVRFLLQGQLAAGRGLELLLDAWPQVDERAVLQLRYVPNEYARTIETRYAALLDSGRVEKLEPVSEDELVEAAAQADVGVVPYIGPNLNHVFACPNKVSQYMQAGLALLTSSDMLYVSDLLQELGCGLTYDPRRPETLRAAVASLLDDPEELARMRAASVRASESAFNWEVVSKPYADAIARLLQARDGAPVPA